MPRVYTSFDEFNSQNTELQTNLPFSEDVSVLGTSLEIGGKIIPNRLVWQAMEGCDGTADGRPDTLTKRRYDRFA